MKYLVLLVLAFSGPTWRLLTWVHHRNMAVSAGTAAYRRGDATAAAAAFETALAAKARRTPDPRLVLNLAHAHARAGQLIPARAAYERLLTGSPAPLSSVARQQLAVQAAQKGELAQALGLLRQALLLDPTNSGARFDYEVLSEYLAQRPNGPKIPPPQPSAPKPAPDENGAEKNRPDEKAGTDHQGEIIDQKPASSPPSTPPKQRANDAGQPNTQQPNAAPGKAAGGRAPGTGAPLPVASGEAPGARRGLDRGNSSPAPAPNGRSNHPGTDAATPADVRLQTQRERLEAMNLSPAQARQLLETLRAQEQQYLQQQTRAAQQKPDPNKPTW